MRLVAAIPAVVAITAALASTMTHGAGFSVGVATSDITPPPGWRMSGYFYERVNTGTHDPLKAKAIVFDDGSTQAAIVFCDLIGVSGRVSAQARRLAAEKSGIPASNIVVAGTHTHTAPLFFGIAREHLHAKAVAEKGKDPCEPIDYSALLAERIAQAVEKARATAVPVVLETGVAEQKPQISFNRRYHMKDGSVRFNPGQKNPDIIRPAGPIDPDVGVLCARKPVDRKPLACLTVFAMHLDTTGGTEYSADYPYYLERQLRETLGTDFVSLFGTGTCGDVNHIDVSTAERRTAEELGLRLARTVEVAIPTLRPVGPASLAVRSATVEAPLRSYTPRELERARHDVDNFNSGTVPFLQLVESCRIMDLQTLPDPTMKLEVQAVRLSPDLAIAALPGEIFADLGLAIKRASPFRTTLVFELANDCPGYIPTKKAFAEGSYETISSRFQPGAGEMIVDAATRLLKELAK